MDKLKKAKLIAQLLSSVPYVRLVLLTGSVAAGRVKVKSDLDFLLICRRGRLYLSRYLCVALMTILGQKSYPRLKKTSGRVCLTFYLADNFLDFSKIDKGVLQKRHQWLSESLPMAGGEIYYHRLMKINKVFAKPYHRQKFVLISAWQEFLEIVLAFGFGYILEKICKIIQNKRLTKYQRFTKDKGIIFCKDYIKLHLGKFRI